MREKIITVLQIEPMRKPKPCQLANNLTALQEAVSIGADSRGLIEVINLDAKTCLICNEEGKLLGLTPNRRLGTDIICGVFYVVGQDRNGNFTSLSKEAMEYYQNIFEHPAVIDTEEISQLLMGGFYVM